MVDKAIPDLTAAAALVGTEVVHIVQSGNSRQDTVQDIADLAVVEVEDDGTLVGTGEYIRFNFVGGGVTLADAGGGEITITIDGDQALNFRTVAATGNFVAADFQGGRVIIVDSVSDVTLTIPTGLAPTHSCTVFRKGAGEVTVTDDVGVVLLSEAGNQRIDLVNTAVTVAPTGTSEEYFMVGKIKA